MNKRDWMAGAGAGALAAACAPAFARPAPAGASTGPRARRLPPLEGHQDRAAWLRYLGQSFRTRSGTLLRLARLDEVPVSSAGVDQFRLVFEVSAAAGFPGGLHVLQHASGQRLTLLLDDAAAGELHAHFSLLA